jgi:hypothetical protein
VLWVLWDGAMSPRSTMHAASRALCIRRGKRVLFREAAALGETTRCFEAVVHRPITGLELETDDGLGYG